MNTERIFGFAAIALVATGLILAFLFLGTPGQERILALDAKRVDDLQQISVELGNRYGYENLPLPARLPSDVARNDPSTKRPYEYHRLNARDYELCVVFATPSPRDDSGSDDGPPFGRVWRHGAGHTCYKINDKHGDVSPQLVR